MPEDNVFKKYRVKFTLNIPHESVEDVLSFESRHDFPRGEGQYATMLSLNRLASDLDKLTYPELADFLWKHMERDEAEEVTEEPKPMFGIVDKANDTGRVVAEIGKLAQRQLQESLDDLRTALDLVMSKVEVAYPQTGTVISTLPKEVLMAIIILAGQCSMLELIAVSARNVSKNSRPMNGLSVHQLDLLERIRHYANKEIR